MLMVVHVSLVSAQALPPMRVLTRVLFNLKNVYSLKQKPAELLTIIKYIREALPDNTSEVRNEGMCLFALERYVESIDALVEYLDSAPEAEDADEVWPEPLSLTAATCNTTLLPTFASASLDPVDLRNVAE
jgi:regulator of sirC expression with transglutaminase-like and TPR domain